MKKGMHKLFSSITCLVLCMSFFIVPVSAETNILYPDPDSYSAYTFFFNHGYNHLLLTSTDNITYNVNLDQSGTNNGSISGTDNMTGSSHNTGTINSNGAGTLGAKYMVCSTNNGTSASQTYSCYFSNRSNAVSNSQSINIGFNENTYSDYSNVDISINETIRQNIDTDITGTISSSTSSREYVYLPWMNGTFQHPSSFISYDWISVSNIERQDGEFDLVFISDSYMDPSYRIFPQSGDTNAIGVINERQSIGGNLYMYYYRFYANNTNWNLFTFDLPAISSQQIIPLYFGRAYKMPDDIRRMVGRESRTNEILLNGNSDTSSKVSAANNANSQVSQKIGQFDSIENDSVNDMSSKINNLNVTPDIIANSKFISSAAWVKTQFDHITVGTPIGSVLAFSLILGVALIFVGKYR